MADDDDTEEHIFIDLRERKKRLRRGEPPQKDIDLDLFITDPFSSPTSLTLEEVKELTGQ